MGEFADMCFDMAMEELIDGRAYGDIPTHRDWLQYTDIIHTTDKAIYFRTEYGNVWIPKSQIKEHDESSKVVELPSWLFVRLNFMQEEENEILGT